MKPVLLEFSNVRSYAQFGPMSFDSRSLVGILGDTGAGKSSILEALCLALYGQASWQGSKHDDLMADGAPHMSVDLTFEHAGHTWRVQRTFYTNTRPTTAALRNLDTGQAYDNVRPVNQAIVELLRMDFDAFRSAVLLPQGQFQRLLHASPSERTPLLRGIFGADLVSAVESLAAARNEKLTSLLTDAAVARAALPSDPAGDAEEADTEADRLAAEAETLTTQASQVGKLIAVARTDRDRHERLHEVQAAVTAARAALDRPGTSDRIASASLAANDLQADLAKLQQDDDAARRLERAAQQALADAAGRGESRGVVDAALALLGAVPERAHRLAAAEEEITDEDRRIVHQAALLESQQAGLAERRAVVADAAAAAEAAEHAAEDAATVSGRLRDTVVEALTAARAVRNALAQERDCRTRESELAPVVAEREREHGQARDRESAAESALRKLQRAAAAAAAAAGFHAGDDCPVCARELPHGWAPADAETDAQLSDADREATEARAASEEAAGAHQRAREALRAAQQSRQEAADAADVARNELSRALTIVDAVAATLPVDVKSATLSAAIHAAATDAASPDSDPASPTAAAGPLCTSASEHAHELRLRAQQLKGDASTLAAKVTSDAENITRAQQELARADEKLERDRARWRSSVAELSDQLRALPEPARDQLPAVPADEVPGWLSDGGSGPLGTAIATLSGLSKQLGGYEDDLNDARRSLDDIAEAREAARARREEHVAAPSREVCAALERSAAVLPTLAEHGVSASALQPPTDPSDPGSVGDYCQHVQAALSDADAALEAGVTDAARQAASSFTAAVDAWRTALEAAEGPDETEVEGGDVFAADALTPVTVAGELARRGAAQSRDAAARARAAIDRAAALDDAIDAGEARKAALSGLRSNLSRSRFPSYLVSRRTEVLLGLASELFGRLSSGEFGFAADFQVVVRRSGSVRDPKTLSGGETFLASLSLALSLVELYSRSGGRLGALFLDEGFGALDMVSLSAALDALSAETGGDKLVAVISHLHAVAEAVTDVLWVSKRLGTSSAHWLEPAEIESLVSADVEVGLLT